MPVDPTAADRVLAAKVIATTGPPAGMADAFVERRLLEGIAAALAGERERARAPFLALADDPDMSHPMLGPGVLCERIRRAAQEPTP